VKRSAGLVLGKSKGGTSPTGGGRKERVKKAKEEKPSADLDKTSRRKGQDDSNVLGGKPSSLEEWEVLKPSFLLESNLKRKGAALSRLMTREVAMEGTEP